MANTPLSPKTRLFIASAKEEDIISAGNYYIKMAKSSKLDEGIVKGFFHGIRAGEDVDTTDLDTPASKKAGKALITQIKADLKAHAANKDEWEKAEAAAKLAKAGERQALKDAVIKDKKESGEMFALVLEDATLVTAKNQLTEASLDTITKMISPKFAIDENGIISLDPENLPNKKEFATALGAVTTMVGTGQTVTDSASKLEAQIGFGAKKTLGESWVNLFSGSPENFSRVQKGVKVYETVDAFKNKKCRALFGQLPFTTSRSLMEFKVTTAELAGTAEKANEENLKAKKEVYLQAAAMQAELQEKDEHATITQRDAKKLVTDYKASLGIEPPVKMKYSHVMHIDKKIRVFGAVELKHDNVRLSMLTFDGDGNRLALSEDGKTVNKFALVGPEADIAKFLLDNATPPELSKEEKAAAALREKEAAKAVRTAAKGNKDKAAASDEQEDDTPAPSTKAVIKATTPVVAEEEAEEEEQEEVEVNTAPVVASVSGDEDEDEDEAPAAPAGKRAIITDDEE